MTTKKYKVLTYNQEITKQIWNDGLFLQIYQIFKITNIIIGIIKFNFGIKENSA